MNIWSSFNDVQVWWLDNGIIIMVAPQTISVYLIFQYTTDTLPAIKNPVTYTVRSTESSHRPAFSVNSRTVKRLAQFVRLSHVAVTWWSPLVISAPQVGPRSTKGISCQPIHGTMEEPSIFASTKSLNLLDLPFEGTAQCCILFKAVVSIFHARLMSITRNWAALCAPNEANSVIFLRNNYSTLIVSYILAL